MEGKEARPRRERKQTQRFAIEMKKSKKLRFPTPKIPRRKVIFFRYNFQFVVDENLWLESWKQQLEENFISCAGLNNPSLVVRLRPVPLELVTKMFKSCKNWKETKTRTQSKNTTLYTFVFNEVEEFTTLGSRWYKFPLKAPGGSRDGFLKVVTMVSGKKKPIKVEWDAATKKLTFRCVVSRFNNTGRCMW